MSRIEVVEHIAMGSFNAFNKKLMEKVDDVEERGLSVEIEYQATQTTQGTLFSALVIGREKVNCGRYEAPKTKTLIKKASEPEREGKKEQQEEPGEEDVQKDE